MPGVQKPHWLPCSSARRCWTMCTPDRLFPIPSTVVTWHESTEQSGARQAFTATCSIPWLFPSGPRRTEETITVQAPQPPSPQPSFGPLRSGVERRCVQEWHRPQWFARRGLKVYVEGVRSYESGMIRLCWGGEVRVGQAKAPVRCRQVSCWRANWRAHTKERVSRRRVRRGRRECRGAERADHTCFNVSYRSKEASEKGAEEEH